MSRYGIHHETLTSLHHDQYRIDAWQRPDHVRLQSGNCIDFVLEHARVWTEDDVTVTINADDPRTIRALELAAEADHWLSGHNAAGEAVYGVPSQSESGRYYIVTESACDCPDFQRHPPTEPHICKHVLAVRLHLELVRAQQHLPSDRPRSPESQPRRGHLSVVPRA